jgi:hypothetical protein
MNGDNTFRITHSWSLKKLLIADSRDKTGVGVVSGAFVIGFSEYNFGVTIGSKGNALQ